MGSTDIYRDVRRMSEDELKLERDLLGPLIRDIVSSKQARLREISHEIERRTAKRRGDAGTREDADSQV